MMAEKFNKSKSRSVKSFFWRNNESKSAKQKKMMSKSIQLFMSQRHGGKENDNNLLHHSINFPVIRSFNLVSSSQNDRVKKAANIHHQTRILSDPRSAKTDRL